VFNAPLAALTMSSPEVLPRKALVNASVGLLKASLIAPDPAPVVKPNASLDKFATFGTTASTPLPAARIGFVTSPALEITSPAFDNSEILEMSPISPTAEPPHQEHWISPKESLPGRYTRSF